VHPTWDVGKSDYDTLSLTVENMNVPLHAAAAEFANVRMVINRRATDPTHLIDDQFVSVSHNPRERQNKW